MKPIRVYDPSLNMLTETDNYLSLQFNPRFYEIGEFELHINQYVEGAEHFVKGNLIVLDKREDKAMLIRHREIALDQNGKITENWRVTGVTLEGVLDQRATIPPADTSHDRKSGNAETVMKHYVENHFVNPVDPDRKIDFIEIAENKNRGAHVEWESRYKNVSDELTTISKQANLGWVIYADMEKRKWIFDVVEPRDVTKDNEAGLQPVFFSPDFSTIKSQQFVDSDLNYKNVGYVGGQGEGVERKIVKIGEAKGIDLHEVFIDARDVSETDEETEEELPPEEYEKLLVERGERKMREFETTFYLEAQILTPSINHNNDFAMSTPFEYETDFRSGDVVEVFNKKWNITMNAPITEFKEIHEANGFVLEAIFGEAQPTLISKIKREFDDLKGIEQQELPARLAVERMREAMEYGDERLSEEERARIEQALENLEASKEYADEEAYQAEQEAKRHADDQDIMYDDEAKRDASEKSEQAKEHADDQDVIVREDAAQDATDKADRAEGNAKDHADDRADEAERNAKDYTDENAVDWEAYNAKMQEIGDDLADKVGVEYVDGQLQLKADSDVVQGIDDTVDGLLGTAADLEQAVIDHADALAEQDGRIIDVETDLDTVEGNLSLVITDLSNLDDTVSQQRTDINANAREIGFKASQDDLDTISGDVSTLSGELSVIAGEVEAKAERSAVESLEGDLTTITNELGELTVSVEGIEGNVSSLTQTVGDHGTEISDLETARLQHADLIEDRVTKTEYSTDMDGVIQEFENIESFRQQHEDWINDRVTSTTFDALEGRVETAEGQISTQAGLIEAKAESSVVDDLGENMTSALLRIDGLEGEITSKVDDGEARSIFTQEAGSFTFDADQINFDGHVFGEDATFAGTIEGSHIIGSTFVSETDTERMEIAGSRIRGEASDLEGTTTTLYTPSNLSLIQSGGAFNYASYLYPYELRFRAIEGSTSNEMSFYMTGNRGNMYSTFPLRFNAPQIELMGYTHVEGNANISNFLTSYRSRTTRNGTSGGVWIADGISNLNNDQAHIITAHSPDGTMTLYPQRYSGQDVLSVRSHHQRGSYRNEFSLLNDGRIYTQPTRDNVVTWSNRVSLGGSTAVMGFVSSSERYKVAIEEVDVDPYKILDLQPKSWYDKGNTEKYADLLTRRENGEDVSFNEIERIERIPGLIAEDVHNAGLGLYVDYGEDGRVEGIDDDRLWTLLIPITKDHNDKIADLENRVEQLEKGVA